MELKGERLIPVPVESTWAALNNPEVLKGCIGGCESLERSGDDSYQALVAMRVGPVSARFKGKLLLSNVKAPYSYTIHFDGQGGVAGFGKGSAEVSLADESGNTRLRYVARAQVGGKMAQVGSRLIDAAAAKIAEDFFAAFEEKLKPLAEAQAAASTTPASATLATATASRSPASGRMGVWTVGALLAMALVYWMTR